MLVDSFDESPCNWQRRGTDEPFFITSGGVQRVQLPDKNVVRGGTVSDPDARRPWYTDRVRKVCQKLRDSASCHLH